MKKAFRAFIIALFILLGINNAQVPTSGLVAEWKFTGNANDSYGTNNGTISGAIFTSDRYDNANSALIFDGNDYISFNNPAELQLTGAISISAWFKFDVTNNLASLISKGDMYTSVTYNMQGQYGVGIHNNLVYFELHTNDNVRELLTCAISPGILYNIICVFSPGSYMKIYLNNSEAASKIITGTSLVTDAEITDATHHNVYIGKEVRKSSYLKGTLDDVRIYNRALSTTEVSQLYNEGSVPAVTVPAISNVNTSSITPSGATISGTVNPNNGSTTVYCDYGTTSSYGSTVTVESGVTSTQLVSSTLIGLQSGQAYHYRLRAVNSAGTTSGTDGTFITGVNSYTLTVTTDGNGTVSPNGSVIVTEGNQQTFTLTPNEGYEVDYVQDGNDQFLLTENTYSCQTVNSNRTIAFYFKEIPTGSSVWTTSGTNISYTDGNVGIGTNAKTNVKLTVDGNIYTEEIKVVNDVSTADFVFEEEYVLKELTEVEKFIKNNKHLPDIPSGKEMQRDGVDLQEMQTKLLQKIEELTLYIIRLEKRIKDLE